MDVTDSLQDFTGDAYGEAAALLYDITESRPTGFALQMAPRLWSLFAEPRDVLQNSRVLDVGCGTGQLANYFLARGVSVTGLDRSAHMLRYAAEKNSQYVTDGQALFVEADATDFVFEEQFAFIVCTFNTLNHLADFTGVERALSCISQALEPGGRLVCDFNTRRGLTTTVATNTVHDTDEEIILRKRMYVDERVILYASGSFRHDETWHRYRETISKIVIDTEAFRQALLDLGFDPVSYKMEDLVTADDDPEAADVAYVVARKPF